MSKPVTILYFAWLRERLGCAEEQISLPPDVQKVSDLVSWFARRGETYAAAFRPENQVRAAVNQVFAGPDDPVAAGDEVAFFPPVTGG